MVNVGDSIPSVEVTEGAPDKKVNIASEIGSGNGLIIGVPAAFSPTCSDSHIPDYIKSPKLKSAGKVFVVSVNDAFVMNAWGKALDADKSSGIRFLGDVKGEFTKALHVDFDSTAIFGNRRSKRYAIVVEGGKVKSVNIEPDSVGLTISAAEKVLA
ncbi:Redoxin [Bisporella sp. PMI_857]|nr:Redoxin [Bisporella sp. PMI_857]